MSHWASTKASQVLAVLLRIGWTIKRQAGTSHRVLSRPDWPDFVFAFHDRDGFVIARVAGDEAEILTLAVAPEARGQGLGRALLNAAIVEAQRRGAGAIFLEVGTDNPAALALYAGLGFANVGSRKGYYGGRDASLLRLLLPADLP